MRAEARDRPFHLPADDPPEEARAVGAAGRGEQEVVHGAGELGVAHVEHRPGREAGHVGVARGSPGGRPAAADRARAGEAEHARQDEPRGQGAGRAVKRRRQPGARAHFRGASLHGSGPGAESIEEDARSQATLVPMARAHLLVVDDEPPS